MGFVNTYFGDIIMAKIFAQRSVICFFVIMLLLLSCVLRVLVIATGNYKETQETQMSYKINVSRLRGTIYDCNMVPITNSKPKTFAAVLPQPSAIVKASKYIDNAALSNLKKGMPTVCETYENISGDGISTTLIYNTDSTYLPACHIIGYTDGSGHGVSGLQLAYDDILYSDEFVSAVFTINGKGEAIRGIEPYFENDLSVVSEGVVTTLDINIQSIVEKSLSKLNSGCAIVAEVESGKIRAMASAPSFNLEGISKSLENENSPLLNRALSAYSIGSIFKPCVAAVALENYRQGHIVNCLGSAEIDNRKFKCHLLEGHGQMNLCTALAQSCNCFFYDLAISLGGEKICKIAAALSLNGSIKIADNLYTAFGNLPQITTLNTDSSLANFGIGQGSLNSSPIAILNLYMAIATDGSYYLPSIVEKTVKNGNDEVYNKGYKTQVMKNETALQIREYLKTVITDGTGDEAAPTLCTAAGKTATAQTGRYYDDGTEIINSWFCGFFPAENPQYAVVVMSDGKLTVSTASIFAEIADGITEYNN